MAKGVTWNTTSAECVYERYLLRVAATTSPHRWRWFVMPLETVERYGRAWLYASANSPIDKGSSRSDARGHAMTLERAKEAAVAMVDAIRKEKKK